MTEKAYTAADIQVLSPIEAIRKRPAMYVGQLNHFGVVRLLAEYLYELCLNLPASPIQIHLTQISHAQFDLILRSEAPLPSIREFNEPEVAVYTGNYNYYPILSALSSSSTITIDEISISFRQGIRKTEPAMPIPSQFNTFRFQFELDPLIFPSLKSQFELSILAIEPIAWQFPHLSLLFTDQSGEVMQQRFFQAPEGIAQWVKLHQENDWHSEQWIFEMNAEQLNIKWKMAIASLPHWKAESNLPRTKFILNASEASMGAKLEKAIYQGLQHGFNQFQKATQTEKLKINPKQVIWAASSHMTYPHWNGPTRNQLDMPQLAPWLRSEIAQNFSAFLIQHPTATQFFE